MALDLLEPARPAVPSRLPLHLACPAPSIALSFIQPAELREEITGIGPCKYCFDVSEAVGLIPDGKLANMQWDFDYRESFTSTSGFAFLREKGGEPILAAQYEFASSGPKQIACSVEDNQGGERTWIGEVKVK